ncbi:MFS transporter [Halorarius litoreus]|uniref:MFS transporter n=1 Tax=Halorarius litoreus TaxID=2962676 RepID=UPI0020CBB065|nr:MFS transporter [Halorarius litoreus]
MSARRTVLKYYLYRPTTFPGFMWPILTVYLLSRGFSFTALALGGTAMAVARLVGELPSGVLADRFGRRASCIVAALLFFCGQLGYIGVHTLPALVAVSAVVGLAEATQSGTLDAYLYDVLAAAGIEDRYTHIRGRGEAIRRWGGVLMLVASGPLYVLDHAYPFFAMAGVNLLSASLLLTFPRVNPTDDADGFDLTAAARTLRDQLLTGNLRAFVLFVALASGVVRAANGFVQPIAVETLDPYLAVVPARVPEEATLGLLYAAFTVVSAVTSDRAGWLEGRLGAERTIVGLPVVVASVLLAPLFAPALAIPAFFVLKALGPMHVTVRMRYLNDRVASVGRATVLSAASLCMSVTRLPFVLGAGVVADAYDPFVAVAVVGAAFLLAASVVLVVDSPFADEATVVTPAD